MPKKMTTTKPKQPSKTAKAAHGQKQSDESTLEQAAYETTPTSAPELVDDKSAVPDAIHADEVAAVPIDDEPKGKPEELSVPTDDPAVVIDHPVAVPEPAPEHASAHPAPSTSERPRRANRGRRIVLLTAVLLLTAAIASLAWRHHQSQSTAHMTAANQSLVAEVGLRVVLPRGETPTITTVVDHSKTSQAFLADAADGDKVLLYFQSGKAILYRPSTHQVVNIGPLSQPPVQVFLRSGNGAQIPPSIVSSLQQTAGFKLVSQDQSPKGKYPQTLVIDLSGDRPDLAARTAQLVHGTVSRLPAGESRPDADILVITGANAK